MFEPATRCSSRSNPSIPMADVTLESMRRVHIPAVLVIENEAFTSPWDAEMFLQEVEDNWFSRSFVALEGERVVAALLGRFPEGQQRARRQHHPRKHGTNPAAPGIVRSLDALQGNPLPRHVVGRARNVRDVLL